MFRFFRRAPAPEPVSEAVPHEAPDSASNTPDTAPTITESLTKTRGGFFGAVRNLFRTQAALDDTFWDDLEERLIAADLGAHVTADLVDALRAQNARRPFSTGDDAEASLRERLQAILATAGDTGLRLPVEGAAIILVIGVNGTGKTTSVAKLTRYLKDGGRRPYLVAGDTFRAAAIDQLAVWADRTGVPMYAQSPGSDPAAVVYDGIGAALARDADTIIIDTAGRLHTKINLMAELEKVRRIIERRMPGAPHETLLVLDAVTGQNGLLQAKSFVGQVGVTGLVLTKLDSSAKGGVVFAIAEELKLPIKLVGTGERVDDIQPFDPEEFVRALFA
jgi:fused signal recognition particle receptor